jgi:hypothetical protein
VGALGLLEVGDAGLRAEEGAAGVDLVHEVVALHRRLEGAGEADGRGVVDEHVDAAEARDGLGDGGVDLRLVAHVDREREGAAAGLFDLARGGVNGARQLRVRLGRLGRDDDVGPVARGAQADRLADAPARAGDEEGLAFERSHDFPFDAPGAGPGRAARLGGAALQYSTAP